MLRTGYSYVDMRQGPGTMQLPRAARFNSSDCRAGRATSSLSARSRPIAVVKVKEGGRASEPDLALQRDKHADTSLAEHRQGQAQSAVVATALLVPTGLGLFATIGGFTAMWESYLGTMAAHPLLTKEVTGILGAFLGDLLAQGLPAVTPSLQQARQRWAGAPAIPTPLPAVAFRYDVWRALRMVGFGALVGTPVNHLWFTALDTTILPEDPTSTLAVVAKMGLDQTLMAPLMTSAFFSTITALEGRPEQIMDVLQAKLRPTLAANYCLWPAAHLVNFGLVPSDQRILYVNTVALLWTAVLSTMANSPTTPKEEGRTPGA